MCVFLLLTVCLKIYLDIHCKRTTVCKAFICFGKELSKEKNEKERETRESIDNGVAIWWIFIGNHAEQSFT